MSAEQQEFTPAETEQESPQQNVGTPGQGQSKSSRRRRRKRNKMKAIAAVAGTPGGAAPNVGATGEELPFDGGVSIIQATSAPQQGFTGEGGVKRWKKKKKKKYRAGEGMGRTIEPGNSIHEPRGQRRNKQRGPRSFVGPMDHSYRAEIGNYADSPPSTIEVNGNRSNNGHGQRRYNNNGGDTQASFNLISRESVPKMKQDAPTRIYCFIEDLFFLAKIQETARKSGVKVVFLKPETADTLLEMDDDNPDQPALIVFDLNHPSVKPLTLIPKLAAKFKRKASIIGFLSHIQGDLKAKAVEAGCGTVMPRSAFSQNLPNMIRRYGLDEVEEPNFNA
jgi:hypothetical protein